MDTISNLGNDSREIQRISCLGYESSGVTHPEEFESQTLRRLLRVEPFDSRVASADLFVIKDSPGISDLF